MSSTSDRRSHSHGSPNGSAGSSSNGATYSRGLGHGLGPGAASSVSTPSASATQQQQHAKRTRVLLSCGPCRNSKLKCDRATPCGQCLKKGRPDACVYAPRPQKQKPAKSMAARLKRLEGMVREMIDTDVALPTSAAGMGTEAGAAAIAGVAGPGAGVGTTTPPDETAVDAGGLIVQGQKATSYVGATHFMAILDDIEDLKNYFEDSDEEEGEAPDPYENIGPPEVLFGSRGILKDKEELLRLLPEKSVIDRLMSRYFDSNSPSQHILHKPTFSKEYNQFWQNPSEASLHWIALLFIVMGLGVFFSSFQAPHELERDSSLPAMDRFKQYRGAAGWALIRGKYSQPSLLTLQTFLLYVEAEFLVNRSNQMQCYLMSSVCIRLMLKMGLHRDPSKLPNVSPYEGEMRRRLWNLAIQIDLLVSFYLGLPSMIQGIESDTAMPRHLMDSDFNEDSKELPPARPISDYTPLTYPIHKAAITKAFGLVARQAHALTVPPYSEVMRVDRLLEETWKDVPAFMKVKPLEESVTDPTMQEHGYSRRACLEAALALLEYQHTLHYACRPGGLLHSKGWFIGSLVINDFLLADMVVALVVQNEQYSEVGGSSNWMSQGTPLPTKDELLRILQESYRIWCVMAPDIPDCRKAGEVVHRILGRIYTQIGIQPGEEFAAIDSACSTNRNDEAESIAGLNLDSISGSSTAASGCSDAPNQQVTPEFDVIDSNVVRAMESMQGQVGSDPSWMIHSGTSYDWNQFDALTRAPADAIQPMPQTDFEFLVSNGWTHVPHP
ncbi:hypothetical protein DL764_006290 [Monosporascus ibericus]|uniref:Zn(2)-C6 fungal-type domain-containing protein n=1 Tax=Monosporascus ibericus TaxID=155417 RepID=A0A4Q4T5I5_9PEZI|nr:hypothetical protein DL764_006290 [Monosporascus ibericus]